MSQGKSLHFRISSKTLDFGGSPSQLVSILLSFYVELTVCHFLAVPRSPPGTHPVSGIHFYEALKNAQCPQDSEKEKELFVYIGRLSSASPAFSACTPQCPVLPLCLRSAFSPCPLSLGACCLASLLPLPPDLFSQKSPGTSLFSFPATFLSILKQTS